MTPLPPDGFEERVARYVRMRADVLPPADLLSHVRARAVGERARHRPLGLPAAWAGWLRLAATLVVTLLSASLVASLLSTAPPAASPDAVPTARQVDSGLMDTVRLFDTSAMRPSAMAIGPDGAVIIVDDQTATVVRAGPSSGMTTLLAGRGDGPGEGMGTPEQVAYAGMDLVISDDRDDLWLLPGGSGAIEPLPLASAPVAGAIRILKAWAPTPNDGIFYSVRPSGGLVDRYTPDPASGVWERSGVIAALDASALDDVRDILADRGLYLLTSDGVARYSGGQATTYELGEPPTPDGGEDVHDYRLLDGLYGRGYILDGAGVDLVFDEGTGAYLEQWYVVDGGPSLADAIAMRVQETSSEDPAFSITWLAPLGVYRSEVHRSETSVSPPQPSAVAPASPRHWAIRTFPGDMCLLAAIPFPSLVIRIKPEAPDPVTAVAPDGFVYRTWWQVGFRASADGPTVVDPDGRTVARDGDVIVVPAKGGYSLAGHQVCASGNGIYIMLAGPPT